MARTVHIVGAGLAGLAAAVRLTRASAHVVVHEATAYPGGRCRSYFDRGIGLTIDNGNHLVLSGNYSVLEFTTTIGSRAGLVGPAAADFPFVDLATGERWTLRINDGWPWWILDPTRRVPGTRLIDYLKLSRLLWIKVDGAIGEVIDCSGPLYHRLLQPLLLAALNTEPREGSVALAAAVVNETLAQGGAACRPLIARDGLGPVFIEPAIRYLSAHNASVRLDHELQSIEFEGGRVAKLGFGPDVVELAEDDAVILAVPPHATAALLPGLDTPQEYRTIVNGHFRMAPPPNVAPMTGVVNGTVEWIFAFADRLSVTISGADRLLDTPRGELAQTLWQDVCKALAVTAELPPWQIVRERRATFAATPAQNARRPTASTKWRNLFLAGDWTATGLPATLESAVRSGFRAADLVDDKARELG
jgi:squalene-associated FAD-dependent desaturase